MRFLRPLALGAFLALPMAGPRIPPPDEGWTVMLRRVGNVRFGMTIDEARAVVGGDFEGLRGSGCRYTRPPDLPPGLRLMIEHGRVVRADIDSAGIRTGSGAAVGQAEEEIERIYPGRITRQPHKYVPEGWYLVYAPRDPADSQYRLIFETEHGKVTRYRAGLRPAVEYVEGCG